MLCINLLLGVTQWTFRVLKPGKDENFLIRPDWLRGRPTSCTMGTGFISSEYSVRGREVERPGSGVDHPPTYSTEVGYG